MTAYVLGMVAALLASVADPEMHVVALREGRGGDRDLGRPGRAGVLVDRPGREVVLVVRGREPIVWDVQATAGTRLARVLAIGERRQTVNAPNGVPVEERTQDAKKAGASATGFAGAGALDGQHFRPMVRALAGATGRGGLSSFQGLDQLPPDRPFAVDAVQADERLSIDFPTVAPAAGRPALSFRATRLAPDGAHFWKAKYGEFTQAGPTPVKLERVLSGIRQVAYDPAGKSHYGISHDDLFALDALTRSTRLGAPKGFGTARALAHDAARDRVVVATDRGLFEYGTKAGKWAQLTDDLLSPHAAVAWQAKTDTLFSFGVERDPADGERRVPTLFELKPDGAVAKRTPLGPPLFAGVVDEYGMFGSAELVDLGAELALVAHTRPRDPETGERGTPEAFLYVIDPKTGKVTLAWKE